MPCQYSRYVIWFLRQLHIDVCTENVTRCMYNAYNRNIPNPNIKKMKSGETLVEITYGGFSEKKKPKTNAHQLCPSTVGDRPDNQCVDTRSVSNLALSCLNSTKGIHFIHSSDAKKKSQTTRNPRFPKDSLLQTNPFSHQAWKGTGYLSFTKNMVKPTRKPTTATNRVHLPVHGFFTGTSDRDPSRFIDGRRTSLHISRTPHNASLPKVCVVNGCLKLAATKWYDRKYVASHTNKPS